MQIYGRTLITLILITGYAQADTVLVRKSDGFPIEYQSGDVSLSVMLSNNPSYSAGQVELKKMTTEEYRAVAEDKIDRPFREARELEKDTARTAVKQKLSLSDAELETLEKAIR